MKRKREMEKKTEIKSAIQELSLLIKLIRRATLSNNNNSNSVMVLSSPAATDADGTTAAADAVVATADAGVADVVTTDQIQQERVVSYIPTRPFLSICTLIIQVLDKIGPTMAVMRQDIHKNVQRLEMLCDSDPTTYSNLVEILNKEAVERCAKKGDSCSKALLWLTRTLDFTAALLEKLVAEPRESMEQIVANSYETTLKPWHGWISASAYKVALKLVPETGTLILLLMDKGDDIDSFKNDIQAFISLLLPLLEDLHSTLSSFRLEKVKST
ncbi:glycolipid transfer protein 3-like [Chenopodium quinoa]|nr:glycolipid transfer protein 3-like [Chenopodium quinoa]